MVWTCLHPTCDRVSKGFANGRTLCWVCLKCEKSFQKRKQKREGVKYDLKCGNQEPL
jgi:hypothetical protein